MKMTKFDKKALRVLREKMQEAMDELGIENVNITVGNISFSPDTANVKVTAKITGGESSIPLELENQMKLYGFKQTSFRGDELVDYDRKKRKYPFIYRGVDGKMYKCDLMTAKMLFANSAA